MNSSKVKTLLLILLAAVNVFLLINLLMAKSADSYLSGEMLEAASEALARKEIYADTRQIPAHKYTQGVISVGSALEERMASAQSFLGEIVAEYDLPDGTTYQSDKAYVSFFDDGRFEYGLSQDRGNAVSLSPVPENSIEPMDKSTAKNLKAAFKKLTAQRAQDKLGYRAVGQADDGELKIAYAILSVDGLTVHDGGFAAVFDGDTLIYLSGRYFFDSFKTSYTMEYIDAPNALFLLKEDDVTVENMQMIYFPSSSNDDEYFLIPSWQITLDNGTVCIFDGVSGYERR